MLAASRAAALSEARVRVLQAATTAFSAAEREIDVDQALADAARDAADASWAGVSRLSPSGGEGRFAATDSAPKTAPDLLSSLRATVDVTPSHRARSGATIVCADRDELADRFPASLEHFESSRVEAIAVTALIEAGATIGVLVVAFSRRRHLVPSATDLLESLAEQSIPVRQSIRLREVISHQALHDTLTGMPNRLALQRRLDDFLASGRSTTQTIALLFVDLDGFKAVNDKLGHQGGDGALKQVSERLNSVVRAGDMVGRLGGDEFLLICENVDDDALVDIAERLRSAVRTPLVGEAEGLALSASVGVSVHDGGRSPDSVTGEELIRLADEAMYESKRSGKDRSTFFHSSRS